MAGTSNSGRRATPTNIHVIRGNPSKKSAAELAGAGTAVVVKAEAPTCPDFLTPDAKAEWKRIAADLVLLGLVSKLDRGELAVYCQAWADWKYARKQIADQKEKGFVESTPSGYKQMSAWMQVANRAEDRMRTAGASFGLNPSARARLQIPAPQGELFPNAQKDAAAKYF
ncbi:phage terminase small subunit P27 family [Collimonas fungivorans]|uniref:phage terminase small subunit P27 family n=1 Tax=Collimonas fungivorans TaxID=158899 RepID=UPI0005A11312|nr:phage terminase small subunit P27 family [Collimonas fungivorans]